MVMMHSERTLLHYGLTLPCEWGPQHRSTWGDAYLYMATMAWNPDDNWGEISYPGDDPVTSNTN